MATKKSKDSGSGGRKEEKIKTTLSRGLELGAKRRELAAEINRIKNDLLQLSPGGAGSGVESPELNQIIAAFIAACW